MSTRRALALTATVLGLVLSLAACSPNDQAPTGQGSTNEALVPVTLGLTYVPDVQFAPFYVAESLGYYEDAGFDVELRHHGANEGLFSALEQGTEDLVVASGDEVLTYRAAGGDLAQFTTIYDTSPVALITPKSAGVTSIADLAGKTIGVPGEFGSTWLGLQILLAKAGMTTDDVNVQVIGYTQTTALAQGHVDAVMGFANGDAVRIADAGVPVDVFTAPDLVSVGVATPETDAMTDAQLLAFREATMKGVAAVIADPEGAVEASTQYIPGMTAAAKADALAVLKATVPLYGTDGVVPSAQWDAMGQAMVAAGMLQSVPVVATSTWTPEASVDFRAVKTFEELFAELQLKATTRPEGSGTVKELDAGVHTIGKKLVEEAAESWMAAEHEGPERAAEELSQLLYHAQVMMIAAGLELKDVYRHL